MLCRRGELGLAATVILLSLTTISSAFAAGERPIYASVGDTTRAPIGWVEFCSDNPAECREITTRPRDVVLSQGAWRDLVREIWRDAAALLRE